MKINVKDIKNTFLMLTSRTYPHSNSIYEPLIKFLPKGIKKDNYGNYYYIIGNSTTMFTSHLDTADSGSSKIVNHILYEENGDEMVKTDGTTILGADDKAGVSIMLYMIAHNIPGVYYFFIGEEVGCIGSIAVSDDIDEIEHLNNITKCISFDRRLERSIITKQLGDYCCSSGFVNSLCLQFNNLGFSMRPDNTGIYTDSASFMYNISECTNISVGYNNEHSYEEYQNLSYLERLANACLKIKWEELPIDREIEEEEDGMIYLENFDEFKNKFID